MSAVSRRSTQLIVAAVAALLAYVGFEQRERFTDARPEVSAPRVDDALARAFERRQSDVLIDAEGVVVKLLRDDNEGSRHQRFIVALASGQSVLIAHNIDLAPRVTPLAVGDRVRFRGEYEWNERGGVVHWTHHDPKGRHRGGWIERAGRTFE